MDSLGSIYIRKVFLFFLFSIKRYCNAKSKYDDEFTIKKQTEYHLW